MVVRALFSDTAADVSLAVLAVASLHEDGGLVDINHVLGVDVGTSDRVVSGPE